MFQIGQKVTDGNKVGRFIGYDFVDGITYLGIRWPLRTMSGRNTYYTAWYTEYEIKKNRFEKFSIKEIENVG